MSYAPNSLSARDVAYTVHPYTDLQAHRERGPLVITHGEGIYVWDEDGKRYLEGLAGLWCTSLGFSEQRLVDAARRQMEKLPYMHIFAGRSTEPVIELNEKLIALAPAGLEHVFLVNSGSEAIDSAIKFIWYYNNALGRPDKKKIISRKRGYHGITVAGGSLTAIPLMQNDFDLPVSARFLHTETPSWYRCQRDGESEAAFTDRIVESLEQLILSEGPDTVAAFFAEPVMGAGGVIVPPPGYYEKVQAVLRRYDVLLLADEVICGFGRTGNLWGSETFGLEPDLLTCAKQLSSAYLPIAAVMISGPIHDAIARQSHKHGSFGTGFTYGGHPVPAAVALETLKIYEERDMLGHVREIAPHFQYRLRALASHPLVGEARGVGLIGGIEIVADKATRAQFPATARAAMVVAEHALAHGLMVRPLPSDTLGICPPLIITEPQVDELFDMLQTALDEALEQLSTPV